MRNASLLAALALTFAAASVSVSAAPATQTWSYSFTGFQHVQSGIFEPALTVGGSFSATDLNADDTIDKNELTALTFRGFDFLACGTESYFTCELNAFSFSPGSPLTLSVTWAAEDAEFTSIAGGNFIAGDRWRLFSNGTFGDRDDTWLFVANTVEQVSVVPEPSAIAMLAAGLAGIAGARWRRRRA